jgi:pyruvate/2-oxoacid:ferredoxin oxidoreductase beta subunit/Pyruvate/2-oxoacid:ferredoxin oxidoreductase gamma subunit
MPGDSQLRTYRNERDYPFCPGCGHSLVLNHLNTALVKLGVDPHRIALVTDIGCQGLADQYFVANAFHGLHGRSLAYATGIKLVDPDLKVFVLIGDGGTGIGGAHLLNAARRNVGMTVLVMNNFNFGMTGGEHSVTTPPGGVTVTTRKGNLERPLDICATVAVNGAGYVWRGTAFDRELPDVIVEASNSESFALLDIWELCTAYYVPNNDFSRKSLLEMRERLGMPAGLLHREDRPEYARAVREANALLLGKPALPANPLPALFTSPLKEEFRFVVAGSAGGKVRSAARVLGEAAILSGLFAAQQDDYPVTVQTGHSISELIFSPNLIHFTGVTRPDALVLATEEGRKASARYLKALTAESWLFTTPEFANMDTPARKVVVDLDAMGIKGGRKNLAWLLSVYALNQLGIISAEACEEAARRGQRAEVAEEMIAGLRRVVGGEKAACA